MAYNLMFQGCLAFLFSQIKNQNGLLYPKSFGQIKNMFYSICGSVPFYLCGCISMFCPMRRSFSLLEIVLRIKHLLWSVIWYKLNAILLHHDVHNIFIFIITNKPTATNTCQYAFTMLVIRSHEISDIFLRLYILIYLFIYILIFIYIFFYIILFIFYFYVLIQRQEWPSLLYSRTVQS